MIHTLSCSPWLLLLAFLVASALMLSTLDRMQRRGLEGTVVGTLVMPYCSGAPNLIFAAVLTWRGGPGSDVVVNAIVNNVTNLSLLIGLPGLLWLLHVIPEGKVSRKALKEHRLSRLSLALTLLAGLFFSGVTWGLGRDGTLSRSDGLALVAIFLFWQSIQVFDVLRSNIDKQRRLSPLLLLDALQLVLAAGFLLFSIDKLVAWLETGENGLLSYRYIGWLSGWLMVLPNALPAFYYAARRRADVVYSSQVGDGHICIPLCIGLAALARPLAMPTVANLGLGLLAALAALHLVVLSVPGRLPRTVAALLLAIYAVFVYSGLAAA